MSKESYGVCWCFRRKFKLGTAEPPQEIKELFEVYSENGIMSTDNLVKFMTEVQGEDEITGEHVESIMEEANHKHRHLHLHHRKTMTLETFFRYLISDTNSPLLPPRVRYILYIVYIYLFRYNFSIC